MPEVKFPLLSAAHYSKNKKLPRKSEELKLG
jgi:hypothetical protein